jgi:hypothetical protein
MEMTTLERLGEIEGRWYHSDSAAAIRDRKWLIETLRQQLLVNQKMKEGLQDAIDAAEFELKQAKKEGPVDTRTIHRCGAVGEFKVRLQDIRAEIEKLEGK